jgi:mycothiol synthase
MSDYAIRNFRWDDLDAIVEVWNAGARAVGSIQTYTASQLRIFFEMPDAHPETDIWIVEDGRRIIAYAADEFDHEKGQGWGECAVHPDYQNRGIGTRLFHVTEARIAERIKMEAKADMPLHTLRTAVPGDVYAIKLFCDEGYREVRAFYTMQIELQQPIEVPRLPEGIMLRPFDAERDARAVYQAHQEAFRDHWNHDRDTPYDEWKPMTLNHPDGDPSLWLVAWDGDEIAGIAINRIHDDERPDEGWVSVLAVRRPWRKRGLGQALLKQSFALFQQRGFKSAALGVDASSLTNAVALYERAGMKIQQERLVFRKMLRGSEADLQE